jgi:hypothetical protein
VEDDETMFSNVSSNFWPTTDTSSPSRRTLFDGSGRGFVSLKGLIDSFSSSFGEVMFFATSREGGDGGDTFAAKTGDAGGGDACLCAAGGELVAAVSSGSLFVVFVVFVVLLLVVVAQVLLFELSGGVVISTGRMDSCRRDDVRGEDGASL